MVCLAGITSLLVLRSVIEVFDYPVLSVSSNFAIDMIFWQFVGSFRFHPYFYIVMSFVILVQCICIRSILILKRQLLVHLVFV